jgi:hypothetical protein
MTCTVTRSCCVTSTTDAGEQCAQPIVGCHAANLRRRGHRKSIAGGAVFRA